MGKTIQGSHYMKSTTKIGKEFEKLIGILETLRSEHGCPWDREQDEKSIINYLLEEVYEVIEAVSSKNFISIAEELGDLLLEVVFLTILFQEKGKFTVSDVIEGINKKMIHRHPHVFSNKHIRTTKEVISEWNKRKKVEKKRVSIFDGINQNSPALLTAFQIGLRASSFGFDWRETHDVIEKMKEEVNELENALKGKNKEEIGDEVGDILFSLANIARHIGINPEISLRNSNKKFIKRFKYIEKRLKEEDKELKFATLEEMDKLWEESKSKIAV